MIHPIDLSKSYVYDAIHKITGNRYIGYRCSHVGKRSIKEDLGIKYFSSSADILINKDEYSFSVLAIFDTAEQAYCCEQRMIKEYWESPELLNKHFVDVDTQKSYFRCSGHNEATKNKISSAMLGREKSKETKNKMKVAAQNRPKSHYEGKKGTYKIRPHTTEEKNIRSMYAKKYGIGKRNVGKHWYMTEKESRMFFDNAVPDGWVLGRIVKVSDNGRLSLAAHRNKQPNPATGKHWYTNKIESVLCFEGNEPDGWIRGRTQISRINK